MKNQLDTAEAARLRASIDRARADRAKHEAEGRYKTNIRAARALEAK